MSELDPQKTAARRKALAQEILQPDFSHTEFADRWGVDNSQISRDKQSKEFLAARNGHLADAALTGIYAKVKEGNTQVLMFVAERLALIRPDDAPAGDASPAQALASFLAADPEKSAMKARIAELEERMGALNGKHKEGTE